MPHPDLNLKLMIIGRRKPGTTLAEHRHHIRHVHGERVLRYIAAAPDDAPKRYVQNPVFDGSYRAVTPHEAGVTDPFALNRDFVTQIWAPDFAALARGRETAFYREHLQGDEDNFVDQATVVFMPVRERELLARGSLPTAAFKLFGLLQRAPGADPAAFAAAWADAAKALQASPPGAALLRHVQDDVLGPPGADTPLHGIDECWLPDEAAARELLAQWRNAVHEPLVSSGLAVAALPLVLLAREDVVHAGPL